MIDDYELGSALFGRKRVEERADKIGTTVMYGTAVTDSDDGSVRVMLDGNVTAAEDGDSLDVELPTSPSVKEGDTVMVTLTGGVAKAPMVTAVAKSGDRIKADIDDFKEYAEVEYTHETEFDEVTGALSRSITATYSATAPNLSPFYSHDLSDVYNATTNPDGYWSTAAANTELTGDGWAHIVMDNSGGSGYMYRYASVRADHIPIVAGTLVVEVKNLVKTGIGRFGMGRTAQALTFDAKDITENGTYYIPAQINDESAAVGLDARWFAAGGVSAEFDARLSYYEGTYEGNYKSYRPTDIDVSQEYTAIHTFEESIDQINSTFSDYYTKEDIDGNGSTTGLARRSELTQAVDEINLSVSQNYVSQTTYNAYTSDIRNELDGLQGQLDGQIEAWYYSQDPTTSNLPASEWTTEELKERHRGDIYFNIENGHSWRWMENGGTWEWQRIPDSDAAAALATAQNAQALAGQKRRIFTATPVAPYDAGDMWIREIGGAMTIWYSRYQRTGEYPEQEYQYHESDWYLASTDDTTANGAMTVGNPNLSPFFSHGRPASGTADDYWSHLAATYTILDDGWGHYANDRSEASSTVYPQFSTNTQPFIEEGAAYTLLVELRNVSVVGGEGLVALRPHLAGTSTQLPGSNSGANSINLRNVEGSGTFYIPCVAADDFTDKTRMLYSYVHHTAGANVSFDIRVSLYEGDYKGTYKPYVDTTLGREIASIKTDYATKAELSVQDGSVGILAQGILTKSAEYTDNTIDTEILGETGAINVTKNAIEQEVSRVYSTKYEAADGNLIEQRGLVDGYIRTDGTISASDTAKEWTTALIGVTPGQVLSLTTTLDETPTRTWTTWIAYCFYDSNQAKVGSRTSKYGTANVDLELSYPSITVPSGAAYIRCSWRYYNVPSHAVLVPNIDATYASKSSLSLTNDAITAIVNKSATYVDPATGQTLTNGLSTTVTQTASDVSTLITDVDGLQTMIRETSDGILVAKSGNAVGALVNADGSFDVVELTWSGGVPTIGTTVGTFSGDGLELNTEPVGRLDASGSSTILMNGGFLEISSGLGGDPSSQVYTHSTSRIKAVSSLHDALRLEADCAYMHLGELDVLNAQSASINLGAISPAGPTTLPTALIGMSAGQTTFRDDYSSISIDADNVQFGYFTRTSIVGDDDPDLDPNNAFKITKLYSQNGFNLEIDTFVANAMAVTITLACTATSGITPNNLVIASIPSNYAPMQLVRAPVYCNRNWGSPSIGWVNVGTDGKITLSAPTSDVWFANLTYARGFRTRPIQTA